MHRWIWPRHKRAAERLDAATERSDEIAQASADAHTALDQALRNQQRQVRRNHLGELVHDQLAARRGHA